MSALELQNKHEGFVRVISSEATLSYEMRVSKESYGCPSCVLLAASTNILPWST